jgi:hypothetical protein
MVFSLIRALLFSNGAGMGFSLVAIFDDGVAHFLREFLALGDRCHGAALDFQCRDFEQIFIAQ